MNRAREGNMDIDLEDIPDIKDLEDLPDKLDKSDIDGEFILDEGILAVNERSQPQ
jgi:hypothetical protein